MPTVTTPSVRAPHMAGQPALVVAPLGPRLLALPWRNTLLENCPNGSILLGEKDAHYAPSLTRSKKRGNGQKKGKTRKPKANYCNSVYKVHGSILIVRGAVVKAATEQNPLTLAPLHKSDQHHRCARAGIAALVPARELFACRSVLLEIQQLQKR